MRQSTLWTSAIVIGVSATASIATTRPAFANMTLPRDCRMGHCSEWSITKRKFVSNQRTGKLYALLVVQKQWRTGKKSSTISRNSEVSYVLCSTKNPAYIFKSDSTYLAHLINPGGDFNGYNLMSHMMYWAGCHNMANVDVSSKKLARSAAQLGYPLNLISKQIELKNFVRSRR